MLIDMAIPSDRNISVKVAEKLSKYKDLEIEITKMWGLKTITVPLVIGALGVAKKGIENTLTRYQETLTLQHRTSKDRPPRIKPHPRKSSIDRIKTMTTH